MSRNARFRFSHTRKIDSAYRYVSEAAEAGVIFNTGFGANGRYVTVDGERLINFGSCSYMALESLLEEITGCPILVAASTSLAHMSALPSLITDGDHIIIDQSGPAS